MGFHPVVKKGPPSFLKENYQKNSKIKRRSFIYEDWKWGLILHSTGVMFGKNKILPMH